MQHLRTHLTVDHRQPTAAVYTDDHGRPYPVLTFQTSTPTAFTELAISLAGHADPAAYLREWALALVNVAARVDAEAAPAVTA